MTCWIDGDNRFDVWFAFQAAEQNGLQPDRQAVHPRAA